MGGDEVSVADPKLLVMDVLFSGPEKLVYDAGGKAADAGDVSAHEIRDFDKNGIGHVFLC